MSVVGGLKALVGRVLRSHPWRANERLGQARGPILSAGIAFYGVFSLFPLLTLGFTAVGLWLSDNESVQTQIIDYVNANLGGLIGTGEGDLVSAEELLAGATDTTTLSVSALVGLLTLLYTGLGWISALREGIRGVFRLPTMQVDIVRAKLYDLVVMLTLGTLIVVSALLSVTAQTLTGELLDLLGLQRTGVGGFVASTVVFLGTVVLNTGLFTVLYKVLARTTAPLRAVVGGALLAALGVAALQLAVGAVLGNVGANAGFLASAAIPVLTLFVWLNLSARVMLFGAAWVAVGPHAEAEAYDPDEVPERSPLPRRSPPVLPRRWSDRALLGAGVVLGATALGAARVAGTAVRLAGQGVRGLVRED